MTTRQNLTELLAVLEEIRSKEFPDVPKDMYYCDGHDGQDIFIFPSHQLVVVILGFSPKPDNVIDFNALLRDILSITSE